MQRFVQKGGGTDVPFTIHTVIHFTFTSLSGGRVDARLQLALHLMPTIVTHAAVPLCLGLGLGSRIIPPRLLLAGVAIAMLPDADVLAFKLAMSLAIAALPTHCCSPLFCPLWPCCFTANFGPAPPVSGHFCWSLCSPTTCSIPSPPAAKGLAGSGRGGTSASLPPGR